MNQGGFLQIQSFILDQRASDILGAVWSPFFFRCPKAVWRKTCSEISDVPSWEFQHDSLVTCDLIWTTTVWCETTLNLAHPTVAPNRRLGWWPEIRWAIPNGSRHRMAGWDFQLPRFDSRWRKTATGNQKKAKVDTKNSPYSPEI